ncbi:MAG TPA: RsmD family RNA methyltransferase [Thermoplasmata archaeon]
MTRLSVELSLENLPLARAELVGAVRALSEGRPISPSTETAPGLMSLGETPDDWGPRLAQRLALARRCLRELPARSDAELEQAFRKAGAEGGSAAFRPLQGPRDPIDAEAVHRFARSYAAGGGTIDLRRPQRRFWYRSTGPGDWSAFEEVGAVDRKSFDARRMPRLPFQRPVSLPPRLGRVAANLAGVRAGHRVVDPFVGTGALLLEAALLGARVTGVDRDDEMVRGALRNFAEVGQTADAFRVSDAADAFSAPGGEGWDAVLTDPPYGRASGSGGEPPHELLRRVLPRWAERVRPGGVVVVVLPGGEDPLGVEWVRTVGVQDRVHRSLTREFRVYERRFDPRTGAATEHLVQGS